MADFMDVDLDVDLQGVLREGHEGPTERERELAAKYTRIRRMPGGRGGWEVWLKVGPQAFRTMGLSVPAESRGHAAWCCWMLAKAVGSLLDAEAAG